MRNDTPIGKFKDFMRVGDNKIELFNMIADTIPLIQNNTLLIATKNEHVMSIKDINSSRLEMCYHEEADSRMFVHVYDASINQSCECGHQSYSDSHWYLLSSISLKAVG